MRMDEKSNSVRREYFTEDALFAFRGLFLASNLVAKFQTERYQNFT